MEKGYRILQSALKHGIDEPEIDFVLRNNNPTRRCYELHEDRYGNAQDMFVGYVESRPWPIEVALAYRDDETVVFHARKVSPAFRTLYESEP